MLTTQLTRLVDDYYGSRSPAAQIGPDGSVETAHAAQRPLETALIAEKLHAKLRGRPLPRLAESLLQDGRRTGEQQEQLEEEVVSTSRTTSRGRQQHRRDHASGFILGSAAPPPPPKGPNASLSCKFSGAQQDQVKDSVQKAVNEATTTTTTVGKPEVKPEGGGFCKKLVTLVILLLCMFGVLIGLRSVAARPRSRAGSPARSPRRASVDAKAKAPGE